MTDVRVTFLGTGGPFADGDRMQTCILVENDTGRFLIDCGATAMAAMARAGVEPAGVDAVLLTHLHGDHFGGLPFLILYLDALIGGALPERRARSRPLLIAGPADTAERVQRAMDAFGYPQSFARVAAAGLLRFITLEHGRDTAVGPLTVTAFGVVHTPEATALRVTCAGKVIAYSGDTAWTDTLIEAAADADLFICLAYNFDSRTSNMLSYRAVMEQRHRLTCRRLILTHIGPEMQRLLGEAELDIATDGMSISLPYPGGSA